MSPGEGEGSRSPPSGPAAGLGAESPCCGTHGVQALERLCSFQLFMGIRGRTLDLGASGPGGRMPSGSSEKERGEGLKGRGKEKT